MLRIQTATVVDDYAFIYSGDPALDSDAKDFEDVYRRAQESGTLPDLPLRNGEKPSIFWLRHPAGVLRRVVLDLAVSGNHTVSMRRIAALCIVKVDEVGADMKWDGALDSGTQCPCVPPKTMDALDTIDEGRLINDIALHILAQLTPSKN